MMETIIINCDGKFKQKLKSSDTSWSDVQNIWSSFSYKDEGEDLITGSTELEWKEAVSVTKENGGCIDMHSYDFPCINNERNVNSEPRCCGGSCDTNVQDTKKLNLAINPTLSEYKYSGEALRAVALPLGPIGGGSIAIAGDGGLRQWQICNNVCHDAHVPDSFFAIKVGSLTRVLQSDALYDDSTFHPAPFITDHVIPSASRALLKTLPGVKEVEITAKYPVVEVDYKDPSLQEISIHLETFSPKIPLDSKSSCGPFILFDFNIKNLSNSTKEVSLLASLQNIAGWDGQTEITNQVENEGYGGNTNSLYTEDESTYGIIMSNTTLRPSDAQNGQLAIIVLNKSETAEVSSLLQYNDVKELWRYFTNSIQLPGQGITGVSKNGTTFNGAVCCKQTVDAESSTHFTFAMFWYFPNRYKNWSPLVDVIDTKVFVGNHYACQWKSIFEVISFAKVNFNNQRTLTYKFRDSMYISTLPWQLVDSAAARASVLNSPTCMWHSDNIFYMFEGCSKNSGCCPLNCTHVLNFEMALSSLYPEIERGMREVDLMHQITPHGVIPSRSPCPLTLRRLWSTWPDYSVDPASTMICVDGEIGTVFKTYREVRHGASKDWLTKVWPAVKRVMYHWLNDLDTLKNGMIYGPQPNTYDVATYGYSTLIGLLYLCGLRAAEEMATMQDDLEFKDLCHERFVLGLFNLDKACYTNGKWYTHVVDPAHPTNVLSTATFIGGMYGQWWAYILDLGDLLPREHIKSHLLHTYRRNFVGSFDPDTQKPRAFCDSRDIGWVQAVWDEGEIPDHPLRYSTEVAWSGVAYPFAFLLFKEGLSEEAVQVLSRTREMYDGTRRSPWNEIECGDHYARPMSGFAFFQMASGIRWSYRSDDVIDLSFDPIINTDNFKGFFILGTCWGTFAQNYEKVGKSTRRISLVVHYGELKVDCLSFRSFYTNNNLQVEVNGTLTRFVPVHQNGDFSTIQFHKPFMLTNGDTLLITLK